MYGVHLYFTIATKRNCFTEYNIIISTSFCIIYIILVNIWYNKPINKTLHNKPNYNLWYLYSPLKKLFPIKKR